MQGNMLRVETKKVRRGEEIVSVQVLPAQKGMSYETTKAGYVYYPSSHRGVRIICGEHGISMTPELREAMAQIPVDRGWSGEPE